MCLALPGQIVEIAGTRAKVSFLGNIREADLSLVDAAVGDWVLVHAGFAIQKLSSEDAQATLGLFAEMNQAIRDDPDG